MKNTSIRKKASAESIRGKATLLGSEHGIPGLAVEIVDQNLVSLKTFGPATTDAEGVFELHYVGKDISRFLRNQPALYLRVSSPDAEESLYVTPEPVQYPAGAKDVHTIELPADLLPLGFIAVSVSPLRAGLGGSVRVCAIHQPGAQPLFSIDGAPGARLVEMAEDADVPGLYWGEYEVQLGDRTDGAAVGVLLTERGGEFHTKNTEDVVSIDGVPPIFKDARIEPSVIQNGQTLHLQISTKPNCTVLADLVGVDTEAKKVVLREERGRPGNYAGRATISSSNRHENGAKHIDFEVVDAFGNSGDPYVAPVELRNSQLHYIEGLSTEYAVLLDGEGICTIADLRTFDTKAVAERTGIAIDVLCRTQALARFQTLEIPPTVAAELYDKVALKNPSALAFVKPNTLGKALKNSIAEGRLQFDGDLGTYVADLIKKGSDYFDALAGHHVRDRIKAASRCEGYCTPEDSALGCLAYLQDLLQAAGFTTSGQLRHRFGWDLSSATTAPVRRIALCIEILEATLQVNPQHKSQKLYDKALNQVLIGLTGKSMHELAADAAYAAAMATPDLHQQNRLLAQGLRAANMGAKVDASLQALEPQYLKALVDQSGKTPEELLERYGLSFSTRECQESVSCQQAILVLQRYLMEQADKDGETGAKPLLRYDTWRHEKIKHYHPENIYAVLFKDALIGGERDLFKRHLAKAQSILDTVRLTDGQTPSPEDIGALLSSFRNRNPYYKNFKAGLDLIERCMEIDDLFRAGHNAFFTEEYSLAQYYYYSAARMIRQVCRALSKGLVLPPFSATEPELSEQSVSDASSGKTLPKLPPGAGWVGPSRTPDFLLEMSPDEVRQAQTDFVSKLYYSYLPGNVPGVELGRGQIPLRGVAGNGSFSPIHEAYTGSASGHSAFQEWASHFKKQGWGAAFGTLVALGSGGGGGPGTIYFGWKADNNGNLWVDRTGNLSIQSALLYDLESSLDRVGVEVECVVGGACDCGVLFQLGRERWQYSSRVCRCKLGLRTGAAGLARQQHETYDCCSNTSCLTGQRGSCAYPCPGRRRERARRLRGLSQQYLGTSGIYPCE